MINLGRMTIAAGAQKLLAGRLGEMLNRFRAGDCGCGTVGEQAGSFIISSYKNGFENPDEMLYIYIDHHKPSGQTVVYLYTERPLWTDEGAVR